MMIMIMIIIIIITNNNNNNNNNNNCIHNSISTKGLFIYWNPSNISASDIGQAGQYRADSPTFPRSAVGSLKSPVLGLYQGLGD